MNTFQRLTSNTLLAFVSTAMVKVSNSILFIIVGRTINPQEAGSLNLGITYFTIVMALSTWGLHELLVREAAPRRQESGRYFINYLTMRLILTTGFYGLLLLFLRLNLPYSTNTKFVIQIIGLAAFSEAVFSLCQALFTAYEELIIPTIGATINSTVTLAVGAWFLYKGGTVTAVAWAIPIGSIAGIIIFLPALFRLFRKTPQTAPMLLSWSFSREQLRSTPGFILLGIFSTLNFQADTFLISLFMNEANIGYYGAAQTILMGFLMAPNAIRTSLYPLMARYKQQSPPKLIQLYYKSNQYLLISVLPIAAGITILANPIIRLVFGNSFGPAVNALQVSIWAIPFLFITVPPARLMLVYNHQQAAGWIRGLGMLMSVGLNLWLIPQYGIIGASIARVLASATYFCLIYLFVQVNILKDNLPKLITRPILATVIMAVAVWPLRQMFILWPIIVGIVVYSVSIYLLKVITFEDQYYLKQLLNR
jgi:O-antigen/teichoic acid export membrane protein